MRCHSAHCFRRAAGLFRHTILGAGHLVHSAPSVLFNEPQLRSRFFRRSHGAAMARREKCNAPTCRPANPPNPGLQRHCASQEEHSASQEGKTSEKRTIESNTSGGFEAKFLFGQPKEGSALARGARTECDVCVVRGTEAAASPALSVDHAGSPFRERGAAT
jgi:hypothetical protein